MIKNIKSSILVAVVMLFGTTIGLSSCDKGTSPGETNVERSGIVETEDTDHVQTTDVKNQEEEAMEKHYDHADHENHKDNNAKVIGDGAYDGKGNGVKRNKVDQ